MIQNPEHDLTLLYNDRRLADLFDVLDQLHTAASDDQLDKVTTLSKRELIACLHEFIYVAQETLNEIEGEQIRPDVVLRLLDKPHKEERSGA